jgi:predicted house-cleaning noncanonical NTP pyrophosphatase (MazG superfamily)
MWFIGNDERATHHAVLPWYHSSSEFQGPPKAAPRRKLSTARDFEISTSDDWAELRRQISAGRHVERIVVEPSSADLVRNPEFAEELAKFAAKHNIVVELKGGILSHAYYMLRRHGAHVECIDLFGAEDEIVEYNKLVRDKIPALIEAKGERVDVFRLAGDALLTALRQKLVEEALEALDANAGGDLVGELADVQEVLNAIIAALALDNADVEKERSQKRKKRGGFQEGFMLRRTSTLHSLSQIDSQESGLSLASDSPMASVIIHLSLIFLQRRCIVVPTCETFRINRKASWHSRLNCQNSKDSKTRRSNQ